MTKGELLRQLDPYDQNTPIKVKRDGNLLEVLSSEGHGETFDSKRERIDWQFVLIPQGEE